VDLLSIRMYRGRTHNDVHRDSNIRLVGFEGALMGLQEDKERHEEAAEITDYPKVTPPILAELH